MPHILHEVCIWITIISYLAAPNIHVGYLLHPSYAKKWLYFWKVKKYVRHICTFLISFSVLQLFTLLSFFSTRTSGWKKIFSCHDASQKYSITIIIIIWTYTMSSDADADADGVVSTHSTQNVCNISHLKRRHVIMASLLLYNQQIMVQLLMIRGFCLIVLPKKKKRYTRKRKHNNHREHQCWVVKMIVITTTTTHQSSSTGWRQKGQALPSWKGNNISKNASNWESDL